MLRAGSALLCKYAGLSAVGSASSNGGASTSYAVAAVARWVNHRPAFMAEATAQISTTPAAAHGSHSDNESGEKCANRLNYQWHSAAQRLVQAVQHVDAACPLVPDTPAESQSLL